MRQHRTVILPSFATIFLCSLLLSALDNRYNRLYLADVNDLFACNLDDGISAGSRMLRYKITQEQRKEFYLEAISRQR